MSKVTLTITGSTEGSDWTSEITGITGATQVKSTGQYDGTPKLNLTSPNLGEVFSVSSFGNYSNPDYITWRSVAPQSEPPGYGQYLFTGFSMDVWSSALYTQVITNSSTWSGLVGSYSLSSDKWSLVYQYDNANAKCFSKGGTLTITYTA